MHNDWHSSDWVLFAAAWTRILYVAMLSILLQNLTHRFWNLHHTRAIIMVFSREIQLQRPCTMLLLLLFFTSEIRLQRPCTMFFSRKIRLQRHCTSFLHVKSGCGDPPHCFLLLLLLLLFFLTWNPAAETPAKWCVFSREIRLQRPCTMQNKWWWWCGA